MFSERCCCDSEITGRTKVRSIRKARTGSKRVHLRPADTSKSNPGMIPDAFFYRWVAIIREGICW